MKQTSLATCILHVKMGDTHGKIMCLFNTIVEKKKGRKKIKTKSSQTCFSKVKRRWTRRRPLWRGQLIAAGIQESEFFKSVDAGSQTHASGRPHSQESMSSTD